MPNTRKRLVGPLQLANAANTEYTVPANTKTIIKAVQFSNPTGGAVTVSVSIGASAAGTRIYDAYSIAAGANVIFYPMWVMDETEILQMFASAATSIVAVVDGEENTLG